jgi:hypothetical protein
MAATFEKSSIVALIEDLEWQAIQDQDEDDPESYGAGYDSGYLEGLRAARRAVEAL